MSSREAKLDALTLAGIERYCYPSTAEAGRSGADSFPYV